MRADRISHVIGIDDAPFRREHRGDVMIVGAVFAGERLDGVLTSRVRRDGANAADRIIAMISSSRFAEHLQLVMLQGIAVAGFNVIDVFAIQKRLGVPVLVVARDEPDIDAVRRALLERVRGGRRKWRIIETLGSMRRVGAVWIQTVGIDDEGASVVVARFSPHSSIPEPLRVAHLIAGGVTRGESRGRV